MTVTKAQLVAPVGVVTASGLSVSGVVTATSFSGNVTGNLTGNVTGNATGLSGTPNVVLGIATVSAGSTSAPSITPTGDSNTGVFFPSADTIAFAEGGVEAVRIDSSARLLIGGSNTSSFPGNRVIIQGPDIPLTTLSGQNLDIWTTDALSAGKGGGITFGGVFTSDGNQFQFAQIKGIKENSTSSNSAGSLLFSTNTAGNFPTERMRLDSSGRLLIGTNTVIASSGDHLQVNGNITVDRVIRSRTDASAYTTGQTVSVTVPTNSEQHVYQVVVTATYSQASQAMAMGYAHFASSFAEYRQVLAPTGFTVSASGTTISATNTGGACTLRVTILCVAGF